MIQLKIGKILEKNAQLNLGFGFESIQGYLSAQFGAQFSFSSLYKGDERVKQILAVIALNQLETKMDNLLFTDVHNSLSLLAGPLEKSFCPRKFCNFVVLRHLCLFSKFTRFNVEVLVVL